MTRFAGQIDLTDFLSEGGDWSKATDASMEARSSNEIAGIEAQSLVSRQGIASVANVEAAKANAEAIKAGGQARASAAMVSGIADAASTLGGAGISAYGRANNLGKYAIKD